jgi:hypothetical protein
MRPTYSKGHRCLAYLLLVSFFLQSCSNPSIPDRPHRQTSIEEEKRTLSLIHPEAEVKQGPIQMEEDDNSIVDDEKKERTNVEHEIEDTINGEPSRKGKNCTLRVKVVGRQEISVSKEAFN